MIKLKGIGILLHSLSALSEVYSKFLCLLVGEGKDRLEFESLAQRLNLRDNVLFLGAKPQIDLNDYYNSADVFVLPSTVEGHSVAILESMCSGTPIIASDIPGNKESVVDGINGFLFAPENYDDLCKKISEILNNDELRERMSTNCLNIYRERFSTEGQICKHKRIYYNLIETTFGKSNEK